MAAGKCLLTPGAKLKVNQGGFDAGSPERINNLLIRFNSFNLALIRFIGVWHVFYRNTGMKQSEKNELNDRVTAWMITIIVHAAIVAALLFVSMPQRPGVPSGETTKTENQVSTTKTKPKA